MERTEPTLVPEWLRYTGNVGRGGSAVHHSAQSRFLKDSPRFLDRSSSHNSRRSSISNGSAKHPYSSFTRSHRDKNRDIYKEKPTVDDIWDHDFSDPRASILSSRVERNALRHSQSIVSRKPGALFPRGSENSKNVVSSQNGGNGVLSRDMNYGGAKKVVFDKDFPSLGSEEKPGLTRVRRILSPSFDSAVQSLPIGNSGFLGGMKWTSALAEVPASLTNNGIGHPPIQQSIVTNFTPASGAYNAAGLNMAEALSQPPVRVRVTPRLPDKSQRVEELAIKQSKQLIPVTPSMPKPLVVSSADKSKQTKIAVRTNEMIVASRGLLPQPHSSHLSNQSRAGQIRSDSSSNSHAGQIRSDSSSNSHAGKFLVLKPGRENGATTAAKDAYRPTGDTNGTIASNQGAMAPPTPTASASPKYSMVPALENKASALSLSSRSNIDEKRLSHSLAKSRSEFFKLMRRKTSSSVTTSISESGLVASFPSCQTSGETFKKANAPLENGSEMVCNGDGHDISEKKKRFSDVAENNLSDNEEIYPDEEEAAFLRSLGWEENCGEDEGLTEEEINAFYQEYMNRRPSLKGCRSSQPECSMPSGFHKAIPGIASSESSSSK